MLKDHLGNVRMLLTEEQQTNYYPAATLEGDINNKLTAVGYEKSFYTTYRSYIVPLSNAYGFPASTVQNNNGIINPYLPANNSGNSTTTSYTIRLYQLNKNTDKTGLGITLKVMAGDKFKASVYEWYQPGNTNVATLPGASDIATNVINALLSGLPAGSKYSGTELNSSGVLNAPLGGFLTY